MTLVPVRGTLPVFTTCTVPMALHACGTPGGAAHGQHGLWGTSPPYHQYSGYRRCRARLFTTSATSRSRHAPAPAGTRTYRYPSACSFGPPMTASRAVAPPGGWTVRVTNIATMAPETPNPAASQGVEPHS